MGQLKNRRNTYILLSVFLISLLLPTYVFASKVSDGSGIAGISMEEQTIEEAREELQTRIDVWQSAPALEAIHEQETLEIPRDIFQFDVDQTIAELESKMKRHWSNFFMKQKNVQQELIVNLASGAEETLNWPAHIDTEATLANALLQASNLTENNVSLVYVEGATLEQVEIASVSLEIPEASVSTIEYLIENLDGQTIEGNELYSFIEANPLPTGTANSEEEMSFVAAGLYELALQTDIGIIERHQHEAVTSYTEPGLDAKINREENLDLQLYHANNFSYTILAKIVEDTVELTLEAPVTAMIFDYTLENGKEVQPRRIYRYNKNLAPGAEDVIQEGASGVQIEVYRIRNNADGTEKEKELVSRDFYEPVHEIVETAVETEESVAAVEEQPDPEASLVQETQAIQATCAEDPTQCDEDSTVLLPLFLSCMQESSLTTAETATNPGMPSACDLLVFYLSFAEENNSVVPDYENNSDEIYYDNGVNDFETDLDKMKELKEIEARNEVEE